MGTKKTASREEKERVGPVFSNCIKANLLLKVILVLIILISH